jgi:hypothetical protein
MERTKSVHKNVFFYFIGKTKTKHCFPPTSCKQLTNEIFQILRFFHSGSFFASSSSDSTWANIVLGCVLKQGLKRGGKI